MNGQLVDVMKDILGKTETIVKVVPEGKYASGISSFRAGQDPLSSNVVSYSRRMPYATRILRCVAINVEIFVKEAAQGRFETLKKIISKMSDKLSKCRESKKLRIAASQGDLKTVELLITAGANLEIPDPAYGNTALHYSASETQPLIMDALLKAGANVDAVNKVGNTPLHRSVTKQHLECVKILLQNRCNVNIQNINGNTALHNAIGKDDRDIIGLIVDAPGTDFTLKNKRGFNVLDHAALKGNHYAVRILLQETVTTKEYNVTEGCTALHLAILNGDYLVAKTLIQDEDVQKGINIRNLRDQTALTLAITEGYSELVELLVSVGADVSVGGEDLDTPLHIVLTRHFDIQAHQRSHSPNPDAAMRLKKLDNAPRIAEIFANLGRFRWSPTDVETPAVALACFIVQSGADVTLKRKRVVSFLSRSNRLRKALNFYSAQSAQSRMRGLCITDPAALQAGASKPDAPSTSGTSGRLPLVNGASSSSAAASTVPEMGNGVPAECMHCAEVTYLIHFDPCGHKLVCEECCIRLKKCVSCQQVIRKKVNRFGQGISAENRTSNTATLKTSTEPDNLLSAEIEEAYYCPICMERRRNVAFLCGHGACEKCADALSECHMCRTPITQKINLY